MYLRLLKDPNSPLNKAVPPYCKSLKTKYESLYLSHIYLA